MAPQGLEPPCTGPEGPLVWGGAHKAPADSVGLCVQAWARVSLSEEKPACLLRPRWKHDLGLKLSTSARTVCFSCALPWRHSVCSGISPFATGNPKVTAPWQPRLKAPVNAAQLGLTRREGKPQKLGSSAFQGWPQANDAGTMFEVPSLSPTPASTFQSCLNSFLPQPFYF